MPEQHNPQQDRLDVIEEFLNTQVERRSRGVMENHAQTIIVFVILGVLSWVGYSIMQTAKEINTTNTSIAVMKADMSYMKNALDQASQRYVTLIEYNLGTTEIHKDLAEIRGKLDQIEKRCCVK